MKDQYVGDVNDFRKYGLLRALQAAHDGTVLVAWMLTPDDGGRDGGFRDYLRRPKRHRDRDPQLFDALQRLVADEPVSVAGDRLSPLAGSSDATPARVGARVAEIERAQLLPRASWFSELVPDGRSARADWGARMLRAAAAADLVFVDPDNGIEVTSRPLGTKGSSKYVAWQELEALWRAGSSVLVYQHFGRVSRGLFVERLRAEIRRRLGARHVHAIATRHVLFLLACQDRHAGPFAAAVGGLGHWGDDLRPVAEA